MTRLNSSLWLSCRPARCSSRSRRTGFGSSISNISDSSSRSASGQRAGHRRLEPLVHDVHRKAALSCVAGSPAGSCCRQTRRCSHLPSRAADLKAGAEPLSELDDRAIQVGNAHLKAVGHGQLVGEHQELVGQRRPHLEVLEASQARRGVPFAAAGPSTTGGTSRALVAQQRRAGRGHRCGRRREREDVLVAAEVVCRPRALYTPRFSGLVAGKPIDGAAPMSRRTGDGSARQPRHSGHPGGAV